VVPLSSLFSKLLSPIFLVIFKEGGGLSVQKDRQRGFENVLFFTFAIPF